MRWLELNCSDCQMFHDAISPGKYAFLMVHKDAMKKMWHDQGRKFWLQFLFAYRMYQFNYGFAQDIFLKIGIPETCYFGIIDEAFIYIHKQFVEGTFGMARSIIDEIVVVAQNESMLADFRTYSSIVGSPFVQKETRDAFRNLFGERGHKVPTAIRAFLQAPVYCHFAGAVINALQAWLLAPDMDPERIKAMENEVHVKEQSREWLQLLKGNFATYLQNYWGDKLESLVFLRGNPAAFSADLPKINMDNMEELINSQSASPEPTCSKHKQNKKKKKKKVLQLQKQIKSLHTNNTEKQGISITTANNDHSKTTKLHTSLIATDSSITLKIEKSNNDESEGLVTKLNSLFTEKEDGKLKTTDNDKPNNQPKTVKEKLDVIEDTLKTSGGIGLEEFMLLLQAGKQLMGGSDDVEETDNTEVETQDKAKPNDKPVEETKRKNVKLHKCAFCKKEEPSPKTFKKCARCKSENFVNPRYYCSRDCQVEDWEEWHREEHNKVSMAKTITF